MTDKGLVATRSQIPDADLTDLERDRRLGNIFDLFKGDLLARHAHCKLEGGG